MFNVILYQPEIPPNTGNIIRLSANAGAQLHLVEPLGFVLDDARLRRAGLDYGDLASVKRYTNWDSFKELNGTMRIWAFSTRGGLRHDRASFREGDGLLFGPETRGLPDELIENLGRARTLRLPMRRDSRSLNLSNTVAIGLYEALRQCGFRGLK